MTDHSQLVKHPRIWLEPAEDADPYTGQMWFGEIQVSMAFSRSIMR